MSRRFLKLKTLLSFAVIGIGVDCVHLRFLNGCGRSKKKITAGTCIYT